MDADTFFKKAGFRSETFSKDGVKIELRELSLAQRRAVLESAEENHPTEVMAALAVSMSCPAFTEDDVEKLVETVRPEILVAAASQVYRISNMVSGGKDEVKKPLGGQSGRLSFVWPWKWGRQSESLSSL